MEQVIIFVLRNPTARKWLLWGIAALVAAVMAMAMMLLGMASGGMSSTIAANAKKPCEPNSGSSGAVVASNGPVRLPFKGKFTYTSPFGMRSQPMTGEYRLHAGADLALSPTGGAILAAKDGKVVEANANQDGAGNNVKIDHGGGLMTRYLHLASFDVKPGQTVKVGETIGKEGNTTGPGPSISTGAHLHFEVHENGKPVDPIPWLKKQGIDMPKVSGTGTASQAPAKGSGSGAAKPASAAAAGPGAKAKKATAGSSSKTGQTKGGFQMPKPDGPGRHTPGPNPPKPPAAHMKAFKSAGEKYGIPWQWLSAHSYEETHHYEIKAVSSAGAIGPMQFTPPTWQDFGVDGNGDGKADIRNVDDAVHSAANMLAKTGGLDGPQGVKTAIKRYNQADWYVSDILWLAGKYGNGNVSVSGSGSTAQASGSDCTDGIQEAQTVQATQCVTQVKKKMTPEQRAGQLVMAAAEPGSSLDSYDNLGNMLYLGGWSGGVSKVKANSDRLQQGAPTVGGTKVKMLVAADQEGGEVQQLTGPGFSTIPAAQEQATSSDLRADAKGWGQELKSAGVNVNLAPTADTVPSNIGTKNAPIGKWGRQYGATPGATGDGAGDFAKGMQDASVEPTVKHFPGIGRITGNTDLTATGISDEKATTKDAHLEPFKDVIGDGTNLVMIGSARYPKIDGDTPAVFSEKIITGLLRDKMGYDGVVVTDDVGIAKAVADTPVGDRATDHITAGGDIVLTATPTQVPTMIDALTSEAESDPTFKKKMDASVTRVLTLKEDMGLLSCDEAAKATTKGDEKKKDKSSAAPPGDVPSRRGGGVS